MPVCCYQKIDGTKCMRSGDYLPYFWFRDAIEKINQEFKICQDHSNSVLEKLLSEERQIQRQISSVRLLMRNTKKVKNYCMKCRYELVETYRKCPRCGVDLFSNKRTIAIDNQEEKSDYNTRLQALYRILNNVRNKKCRLCNHPLYDLNCPQCAIRQTGFGYSHADFKSPKGFRRADILFHLICGRIWLQTITGIQLLETVSPQTVLFPK